MSNFSIKFEDISSPANRIFQLNDLCRNGSKINIHQYKRKTCKLKDNFLARDRVVGIATKRFCNCLVPTDTIYVDCNAENVINLIAGNICYLQGVGETARKCNYRFKWHGTRFKNPEQFCHCRTLTDHFNGGVYKKCIIQFEY